MKKTIKNKIAIVTGAGSGLGSSLCKKLLAQGAIVFALDINKTGLENLKKEADTTKMNIAVADVTNRSMLQTIFDEIVQTYGHIDYVFNNAGITLGGATQLMTWQDWEKIININEWGVIYGTQIAYEIMLKQGYGHIINTSSTAGMVPVYESVAYTCTKHAVVGLSLSLAEEAKQHGINVSVLILGPLDTAIFKQAINIGDYNYEEKMNKSIIHKTSPAKAAEYILKQVLRQKVKIVVPKNIHGLLLFYKLFPKTTMYMMRKVIK